MLKYATIESIAKRLESRITVVENDTSTSIMGVTGSSIGTGLITLTGEGIEEFIDLYLNMVYIMPLKNRHAYLNSIVEKMIVADIYGYYFPSGSETPDSTESFAQKLRQQALDEFQVLFDGLGIFVPGSSNQSNSLQNDENATQMSVKAIILPGEELKPYIGYDFNGDNVSDSDLFKLNANVQPSFYTTGQFDDISEGGPEIVNNVRVRPRNYDPEDEYVNFW